MRFADLALGLAFGLSLFSGAAAYEIEEERVFAATGAETARLAVISTADLDVFTPIIEAFRRENPSVAVRYVVASSAELFRALRDEGAAFDVAISSAMDLQTKLANDGFARAHRSAETAALPEWAKWGDRLFAFTQEPAVTILSRRVLGAEPAPESRAALIDLMRRRPEAFRGRIGTYDLRTSGAGYLFATQDARQSESFWRMAEVMGGLSPRLYCCSSKMIDDLESGALVLAYNVLGSYASGRVRGHDDLAVLALKDYTNIMMRTALIPSTARDEDLGARFVDFLVSPRIRAVLRAETGLPPLDPKALAANPAFRPIRLGPGVLVHQDQMKRRAFLKAWTAALVQR